MILLKTKCALKTVLKLFTKDVVNGTMYKKENVVKNKKDLLKRIVN